MDISDEQIIAFVRSLTAGQCLEIAAVLGYGADCRGPVSNRVSAFCATETMKLNVLPFGFTEERHKRNLEASGKALRQASGMFFDLLYQAQDKSDIETWPRNKSAARIAAVGAG